MPLQLYLGSGAVKPWKRRPNSIQKANCQRSPIEELESSLYSQSFPLSGLTAIPMNLEGLMASLMLKVVPVDGFRWLGGGAES